MLRDIVLAQLLVRRAHMIRSFIGVQILWLSHTRSLPIEIRDWPYVGTFGSFFSFTQRFSAAIDANAAAFRTEAYTRTGR